MQENVTKLELLSVAHIGVVVRDIDETMAHLSTLLGMGPWTKLDYASTADQMVVGEPFQLKIAGAQMGQLGIELLQPVDSPNSVWAQHLKHHGEGLHHTACRISNLDSAMAQLKEQGGEILVAASPAPEMNWCYAKTAQGGLVLELMDFDLGL